MEKTALTELEAGGLCLGWNESHNTIYINPEDTHSILIGATRASKTRTVVLESVGIIAAAGENIVAPDPKGELYLYTSEYLRRLDYEVIAIDFKYQDRGNRYNFCQPVLDAVYMDDLPLAVSRARDIAQMLVPTNTNSYTDPIWHDGQRSVITLGILTVCLQHENPEHQNLANAYDFISRMCKSVGPKGEIALTNYLASLPQDSPLIRAIAIAEIAPEKMRGSFFTSALTALELFCDPMIHDMTKITDFDHMATGERKRAIFIILPDERKTYHHLAALFVYETYQMLARHADQAGGRLPRRVHFLCEEFGNFVTIPDFTSFLTMGGGRGIRFHLVIQDFNQIYSKYGKDDGQTIVSNCETLIYLQTGNLDTLKELSEKLDNYTIKVPTYSGSSDGHASASYSYAGRPLLMPGEIKRIRRPYQLVMGNAEPVIMYAPDISKTIFNKLYGMGNKKHNTKLQLYRNAQRPVRTISVSYWDGWKPFVTKAQAGQIT